MMISALLAFALARPPADFPAAQPATIAQVQSNPASWHGKWVRVQGWVARCSSIDCALSEGPTGAGLRLSFEPAKTFDDWVQPQLPAFVEVTARLDTRCINGAACLDRAPILRRVHVQALSTTTDQAKDQ